MKCQLILTNQVRKITVRNESESQVNETQIIETVQRIVTRQPKLLLE